MSKIVKSYRFLFLFVYQDIQNSKSYWKEFFHSYTIISKTLKLRFRYRMTNKNVDISIKAQQKLTLYLKSGKCDL